MYDKRINIHEYQYPRVSICFLRRGTGFFTLSFQSDFERYIFIDDSPTEYHVEEGWNEIGRLEWTGRWDDMELC